MKIENIICDICDKPIDNYNYRRFKVKMKGLHFACSPFDSDRWYKMDVHDECFEKLCKAIALTREQGEIVMSKDGEFYTL